MKWRETRREKKFAKYRSQLLVRYGVLQEEESVLVERLNTPGQYKHVYAELAEKLGKVRGEAARIKRYLA